MMAGSPRRRTAVLGAHLQAATPEPSSGASFLGGLIVGGGAVAAAALLRKKRGAEGEEPCPQELCCKCCTINAEDFTPSHFLHRQETQQQPCDSRTR